MVNNENIRPNTNNHIEEIDIKELIISILQKWYIFVIVGVISLIIAIYVILSSAPKYSTEGTILIRAQKDVMSMASSEFSMASDIFGGNKDVQDEIIILQSKAIMHQMILELDLQTQCLYEKRFGGMHELYRDEPINIIYPENFKQTLKGTFTIKINKKKNNSWKINIEHKNGTQKEKYKKTISDLSQSINTPWGQFVFIEQPQFIDENYPNYKLEYTIKSIKSRIEELNKEIIITLSNKKANAIKISIVGGNILKNESIINKIIELYEMDNFLDNQRSSMEIETFITQRINLLDNELQLIEKKVEEFRLNKNIANIHIQSQNAIEAARDYEKLLTEVDMEYTLMTFVEDYIKQSDLLDLIPSNTGITDNNLSNLIISYNYEVMEYLRLTRSTNENNPYISQLKKKILLSRENILQTITNMKEGTMLRREDIVRRNKEVNTIINNVPTLEREYIEVAREQEIKRNLYLFLLQKREENQLAMSSAKHAGKIIDRAYTSEKPVSPQKKMILFVAFFFTIVISLFYIYIETFFKTTIQSKKQLEKITKLPIIGMVPQCLDSQNIEITKDKNNNIAIEAFRTIRTNIQLYTKNDTSKRAILVTSTQKDEGKSFIALNLALSFASLKRKTILVEMNIRQPILNNYLNSHSSIGISEYLNEDKINVSDIIQKYTNNQYLDIIPSYNIPENPTELLNSNKLNTLFEELYNKYEYIIIDTAPIGIVSDTLLLEHLASTTLFICRKNITQTHQIEELNKLTKKQLLNNVSIIFNGIKENEII